MVGNLNLNPASRLLEGTTFCPLVIIAARSSPKIRFHSNSGIGMKAGRPMVPARVSTNFLFVII